MENSRLLTHAWPRQPLIGIALAAVCGIILADGWPAWGAGCAFLIVSALFALLRRSSLLTYIFVATAFFCLHALRQTHSPGILLARELGNEAQAVTARGTVVSEPRVSGRGTSSFRFQLSSLERSGESQPNNATLLASWRSDVRYGDELQLFGVTQPTEPPRNPGEFDMRAYLARDDIHHALVVRYPENGKILSRDSGNRLIRWALASRAWMQSALARGLAESAELNGLISGIVLGVRDQTPDEIEEQFQQTGTLHLFAVSGLNVAIVAQLLWILARALRLPRKWTIGLIIPALFFYAAVTGLNASSVRAALMAAVLLGGFYSERKVLPANSVAAAAVLVLCYDTNELFSTGFQLSFAVVIAIFLLGEPLFRFFLRWCEPDALLPKSLLSRGARLWQTIWRAVARGASISLAAWIGSLPLILPYFYLITPISLFANLVVVPLAFLVLAFGLMSLLVSPIVPALAVLINHANWGVAAAILWVVGLFARAPAGHFYLELPPWTAGARVEINVLDLGAGAAIHLRNRGRDWLIDCGPERAYKRTVRSYLRSRGVNRLDGLMLTHGDAAHIGAALPLTRVFGPRQIIDNAAPDRSRVHQALIAGLETQYLERRLAAAPDELELGPEVKARILFPPREFGAASADDQAMVVQLAINNRWRVLLMSDSGETSEQLLLKQGSDLRSDILIKGQHHSTGSGSSAFLDAVRPQLILTTSRPFPENERVKEEWASHVAARGINLFQQDKTGAVHLRFYRQRWEAISFLKEQTFRSHKSERPE